MKKMMCGLQYIQIIYNIKVKELIYREGCESMRKPKAENKYNLKFSDINKLKIADRSQIKEPLFWRNNIIDTWCISESTVKNSRDREFGVYNDYWIGIYDENAKAYKNKIRVACNAFGGMASYQFKNFFDYKEIENELDLEIQEKLISKVNELIDKGILSL